jgi:hypothetical protein
MRSPGFVGVYGRSGVGSYPFGKIADRGKTISCSTHLSGGVGLWFSGALVVCRRAKLYAPIFGLNQTYPFITISCCSSVLRAAGFPTLLMGATLPVLSRFYVRSFAHFGKLIGDLCPRPTRWAR